MSSLSKTALRLSAIHLQTSPTQSTVFSRAFHASTRRPVYLESIQILHETFQAIHRFTGTPWSLTIPLIAVLARASTSLPIQIIQQRASAQQINLSPLIQAWNHSFREETMKEVGHLGPEVFERTLKQKLKKKRRELYKKFHCGRWRFYLGFFQIPVILGVQDVLRRMSGLELSGLTNYFNSESLIYNPILIPEERDLALEGMLWFPNLMLPDPQLILPFMLSGAMLLNTFGTKKHQISTSILQTRTRKGLGVVALCVGPLFLHLPSAMILYWTSSFLLSWAQSWFIDWLIPLPQAFPQLTPKKPWRIELNASKEMAGKK